MRVVRQLSDLKAALEAGERECITPFNSGCIAGVGYWDAVQKLIAEEFPKTTYTLWVCCGRNAAMAHDAMRLGLNVRCEANETMAAKLQSIAEAQGVKFLDNAAA
ncbi:MAG: hypothetical protein J0M34_00340 [Alphaproteobacteria bacterium]|nr:hypothetical protein [Alphaproteobacteria bacterium]